MRGAECRANANQPAKEAASYSLGGLLNLKTPSESRGWIELCPCRRPPVALEFNFGLGIFRNAYFGNRGAVRRGMACRCTRTVNVTSTFNPAEAEFINRKGQGQINGQLFMRQAGGNVVYGAGSVVHLFPQTTYTSERMQKVFQGGKLFPSVLGLQIENEDPSFAKFKRSAKADGQGKFTFPDLAPGNYYVTGVVTWCVPGPYGSCNKQGGAFIETVAITGPQKVELIMDGT